MNDIRDILDFKYKIYEDEIIIYKEFTDKNLLEYLEEVGDSDIIFNKLIELGEREAGENEKVKNLILTSLLKNLNKSIENIKNNDISDIFNIQVYYTDEKKVEKFLESLNEEKIKEELELEL